MPTGASAHDTFWDFVSLVPETTHMVLWLMSDRALPASFRAMDGFGVHTFRFVNAAGAERFVKFHWRPVSGAYSLLWDEAQRIAAMTRTSTGATCGWRSSAATIRSSNSACR